MIVAIHQPNFFPWLGYFDKITRADIFCFLDNVQFPKKGGTWTNRVRMSVAGRPDWVTVPVDRDYSGVQLIREVHIKNDAPWRRTVLHTVQTNYGGARHFGEVFPLVRELIGNPTSSLAEFNIRAIRGFCTALHLNDVAFVLGSTLEAEGHATTLLIEMTRAVGGTDYLCGGGSDDYLDEPAFERGGLTLRYQRFRHPTYPQAADGTFQPGLSIVDALMHCGIAGTERLLKGA